MAMNLQFPTLDSLRKYAEKINNFHTGEIIYLTDEEKIKLCEIVTEAKADYIKTSTGFGTYGATMEDIMLFKEHIGSDVKMKAAGGIRTKEDMEGYLNAGCDRIGTSGASSL